MRYFDDFDGHRVIYWIEKNADGGISVYILERI